VCWPRLVGATINRFSRYSEGGIFNCKLKFPEAYPDRPPKMKFTTNIWHPNVYPNGDVCISILHEPGEDVHNPQETAAMRWNPIHTVNLCHCCWVLSLVLPFCAAFEFFFCVRVHLFLCSFLMQSGAWGLSDSSREAQV